MSEVSESLDLNTLFSELRTKFNKTSEARNKVIARLISVTDDLSISPDDRASTIEAKMGIIKTLDDLLKSEENNSTGLINTLLKRKETESNANSREAAVAMLKEINMTLVGKSSTMPVAVVGDLDDAIIGAFESSGGAISDDELTENTEQQ